MGATIRLAGVERRGEGGSLVTPAYSLTSVRPTVRPLFVANWKDAVLYCFHKIDVGASSMVREFLAIYLLGSPSSTINPVILT